MGASIVRHRRIVLVALVALVCATILLVTVAHRAPAVVSAAPAAREAAGEAVLVVRHASGHDALWLLSPTDGAATAAWELPGLAGAVAVSPADGRVPAPEPGAAHLDRPWAFRPADHLPRRGEIERIDALTWVAADRLLVSGVKKGIPNPYRNQLLPGRPHHGQDPRLPRPDGAGHERRAGGGRARSPT